MAVGRLFSVKSELWRIGENPSNNFTKQWIEIRKNEIATENTVSTVTKELYAPRIFSKFANLNECRFANVPLF